MCMTFQRRHVHHDPGRDIYTDSNKDGTRISHASICCGQSGHNCSTGRKCNWHVSRISHCFQVEYKIRKFKTTLNSQNIFTYQSLVYYEKYFRNIKHIFMIIPLLQTVYLKISNKNCHWNCSHFHHFKTNSQMQMKNQSVLF